jgi:hypothetical protein
VRERDRWSQLVDAIGRIDELPAANRRSLELRPDQDDLDEEIRGHLAISIKERIERGEDPLRRAWPPEGFGSRADARLDARRLASSLVRRGGGVRRDIRSPARADARQGLAATVVVTLALGIGANAAIFASCGRAAAPLVNRDEIA